MGRSDLAIVIPCHNEAATLGPVVREAAKHGRVLVVDDRSTDASRDVARAAGGMVLDAQAPGYDGALETGLRHALGLPVRFVVTLDADGEHDPKLIKSFHARLTARPLVLGVRARPQRLAEYVVGFAARSQFGASDMLCGMKGYGRPVLDRWLRSGAPLNLNMTPAVLWLSEKGPFDEVAVTGTPRAGRPRFGRAFAANRAILSAYFRALAAA